MMAATVVQQMCRCFKFYCMFYFTCDRSLADEQVLTVLLENAKRKCHPLNRYLSFSSSSFSHIAYSSLCLESILSVSSRSILSAEFDLFFLNVVVIFTVGPQYNNEDL